MNEHSLYGGIYVADMLLTTQYGQSLLPGRLPILFVLNANGKFWIFEASTNKQEDLDQVLQTYLLDILKKGRRSLGDAEIFENDGIYYFLTYTLLILPHAPFRLLLGSALKVKEQDQPIINAWLHNMKKRYPMKDGLIADAIWEWANEGMTVTDLKGTIIRVNRMFTRMTGYTEEEAIGLNPRALKSGIQDQVFYHKMWEQILAEGSWSGEIWNKRKDGEIYPEWLQIRTIRNDNGEPLFYVGTFSDLTSQKLMEKEIHRRTYFDELTGLANATQIKIEIMQSVQLAFHQQTFGAIAMIDLDRFSTINLSSGRLVGDELLKQFAQRLQDYQPSFAQVARWEDDNFMLLLMPVLNATWQSMREQVQRLMQEFKDKIEGNYTVDNQTFWLSVSIGVAFYPTPQGDTDWQEVLRRVESALEFAKSQGRERLAMYHLTLLQNQQANWRIEEDLPQAIVNREFSLVIQPQFDIGTHISGAEVLLRWHHAEQGWLPPSQFIPVAEKTGWIFALGEWVFEETCRLQARWKDAGYDVPLSVNISARQLEDPLLVNKLLNYVHAYQLSPGLLTLELTESMLMQDEEKFQKHLWELHQAGFPISLDDFGTGYSSLAYLNELPIDELKIDQKFVREMLVSEKHKRLMGILLHIGNQFGIKVVAEGVETKEQLDFLVTIGCPNYQGYYYSHPRSIEDFEVQYLGFFAR